ncbi:hypothetical protein FA15DRAFT_701871 [Coprinopsis marcescibilis]|uniref:Superoxide dismutase copper/zinc binding domain-containing protein n=1 Tax=Coprinopsis marcescibilis TaxID=230819 RepID=A0A5C3L387_COPMA|nr:hypothetical protein FA15DRAFT_701871 [Coprinopsis marcescibilis]
MHKFSVLSVFTLLATCAISPAFGNPVDSSEPLVEARNWQHHGNGNHHQGGSSQHQSGNNGHWSAPDEKYFPIKKASVALRIYDENEVQGGATNAVVYFTQDYEGGPVSIKGEIVGLGLEPNTERGWHVHESGDLSQGCAGAGGHFNPQGMNHGAPWDHHRHVGDLGNFKVNEWGDAYVDNIVNDKMSLMGRSSIVGRSLVIHLGTDDLGKGGKPDSLTVGASGGRLACGVIGALPNW